MHHESAGFYYKMNFVILALFFGFSFVTYKSNNEVFWDERFGKFYLGVILSGIIGIWLFSNKHI